MELIAEVRTELGKKVRHLRKEGWLPAVLYGKKIKTLPLQISLKDFKKIYGEVGESTIVKLKISNDKSQKEERNVLIHDVKKDSLTDKFLHVDLYQVRMDEKIKASVTLVFVGESKAVKELSGTLVKNIHEVEVEAFPRDIPHEINVDIIALKTFDNDIFVKDLKVSPGVKILTEPDLVVVSVNPPITEEQLKALEEEIKEPVEEVEVVGKKEKEEEDKAEKSEGKTEDK